MTANITEFYIQIANISHISFVSEICKEMEASAKVRGTGIARRSPDDLIEKIISQKAVVALTESGEWAGFCYISSWGNDAYVSNSGLIIAPRYRRQGLGRLIKKKIFELSRLKYPDAKIFGLTTSSAVMKINSEMKYEPVVYSEITADASFWNGCQSCVNHAILISKNKKNCLCTAMLFDPTVQSQKKHSVIIQTPQHEKQQISSGI